ncbi:SNF-related serine/threonine-protein kinase-like isoform X3 [Pomacea canaliculata]|uniref:SNF-related serine/threonine-protein kinase-like isoform X3 n=1 Tax=Pomacea canaliculata TaxID=400727 RepID=UPI000D73CCA2|nr:SNF-related serine/threonine-protein kinase-like isoform X3 [Pomacea canaliculata]
MAAKKVKSGYDGKIAGLYDLEDTIGRGHFAVVKLARHVFTGEKVAVKVIDKTKLDEVSRSHLFQEVRCMKLVQHPNVVRLYEVIDTQTKLYLILELGDGGDMYDYIMKHTGGLEEKLAKRYFRQIVEAISYCHKLHVVHRDLKPENVVFFEKLGLVKLTDFGFSNMFAPGKKLETSCGSLAYSAPEILLGDSYDAPAVDVWSLGVILFMLVVGSPPFQEANDSETLTMIMDCKYRVPSHISDSCRGLISSMLQRDPAHRATLSQIMDHSWLNDGDMTPVVSSCMPLITREMISEEEQNYIVQKMVEGKIATHEEIMLSLEKNSYDHITATYYLLIERRLRKHQQQQDQLLHSSSSGLLRKQSEPSPSRQAKPHLEPLMLSPRIGHRLMEKLETPCSPTVCAVRPKRPDLSANTSVQGSGAETMGIGTSQYVQSLVSPPGTHPSTSSTATRQTLTAPSPLEATTHLVAPAVLPARKCSLIKEESLEEYDDYDYDDDDCDMDTAVIKPVKSLESLDDLPQSSLVPLLQPHASTSPSESANTRRPLKSVCSSPQLLNQIHEENESEDEDDFVPLKLSTPRRFSHGNNHENSSASPEILRKYEQRKKRRGTGQRGTSCSSSDASDTDDTEGRSRKDKLRHKFVHRRDSSDHSSDTDGPGGNIGGNSHFSSGGSGTSGGSNKGGGGRGGGGSSSDKKENESKSNNNNSKSNNNKNCRQHNSGSSKGSLTDASLKLLTRKLSDIGTGVGALLTDCRGSDCDNNSMLNKSAPSPAVISGSGSLHRHSRSTSTRSSGSVRSIAASDLDVSRNNEKNAVWSSPGTRSPVQYLGQTDMDLVCGHRQSLEFSEISNYYADADSLCSVDLPPNRNQKVRVSCQSKNVATVRNSVTHPGCCKPAPNGVPVVPVKSKCCSVV